MESDRRGRDGMQAVIDVADVVTEAAPEVADLVAHAAADGDLLGLAGDAASVALDLVCAVLAAVP